MKSEDLDAPNIWLAAPPPKVESTPPPLGFCTKTEPMRRMPTSAVIIVKNAIFIVLKISPLQREIGLLIICIDPKGRN